MCTLNLKECISSIFSVMADFVHIHSCVWLSCLTFSSHNQFIPQLTSDRLLLFFHVDHHNIGHYIYLFIFSSLSYRWFSHKQTDEQDITCTFACMARVSRKSRPGMTSLSICQFWRLATRLWIPYQLWWKRLVVEKGFEDRRGVWEDLKMG